MARVGRVGEGGTRLQELPGVPTLAEAGIDGVVVEGFIGLVAPKGTPAARMTNVCRRR